MKSAPAMEGKTNTLRKTSVTNVTTVKKKVSTMEARKPTQPRHTACLAERMRAVMGGRACRITCLLLLLTAITILSTVNLVICAIFLGSFKLHLLTMASNNFLASPVLMILASSLAIGFCILCTVMVFKKNARVFTVYGALCVVVFALQLAAVILAFLLRNSIDTDLNKVNVERELSLAVSDNSTMDTWDILQTRYKCCGGRGNSGYTEWENHLSSAYPDSCCTVQYPDCGEHAKRTLESDYTQTIYERIHVRGCVTAIKESMNVYVQPLLLGWGIIGIVISVCLLLLAVFCWLTASNLSPKSLPGRKRLTSTGEMEMQPLKYTSTLNVHLK